MLLEALFEGLLTTVIRDGLDIFAGTACGSSGAKLGSFIGVAESDAADFRLVVRGGIVVYISRGYCAKVGKSELDRPGQISIL